MTEIPRGYCHCGCGQQTKLVKGNDPKNGRILGQPSKYILGHNGYVAARKPEYVVDKITGCWNWVRCLTGVGYGYQKLKGGRGIVAHRLIYERLVGSVPEGMTLDHLCRNRRCVNPYHLRVVTNQENCQAGLQATLLPDQVLWMREKRKEGWTYKALGDEFGVTKGTAYAAVNGNTWNNL